MNETVSVLLNIPEETETIEFKLLEGSKVVQKIVETAVAMANTNGGVIVLGIDDPDKTKLKGLNRVYGIEQNMDLYDSVLRELPRVVPPLTNVAKPLEFKVEVDGVVRTVAIISVPKAIDCFRSIRNHVYVRLNKSNKLLTPAEVIKMSYAKGFEKADKELVKVDFDLLNTQRYQGWKTKRGVRGNDIKEVLFKTGLARKDKGKLLPTRAAVLLFADYPTNLMDTKCTIRILQYTGNIETYNETPNLIGSPITVEGPLVELIANAHQQVLTLLRAGIEMHSGFVSRSHFPGHSVYSLSSVAA